MGENKAKLTGKMAKKTIVKTIKQRRDILDDWHLENMKMAAHKKNPSSWVDKRSLLSVKVGPNLKPNVKLIY